MSGATMMAVGDDDEVSATVAAGRRRGCGQLREMCEYAWRENFVARISRRVGLKFVLITFIMYGLNQGATRALLDLGRVYYFKDRGVEPAETQRLVAWTDTAWNIKFVFALVMDCMPIYGYNYRPYLLFFGIIGTACYALVAAAAGSAQMFSNVISVLLMSMGLNGVVWNDVAIDGLTLRKMKEHPEVDAELPTMQNSFLCIVSIVFSLVSGFVLEYLGVAGSFAIITALCGIATASTLFVEELRDEEHRGVAKRERYPFLPSSKQFVEHVKLVFRCFRDGVYVRMFIFCSVFAFSVDLSGVMIYWMDDVAHYSKEFQGSIATFSWCLALILIVVSGTMCKHFRYRTLFISFQLIQALISSLDLILVCVAKDAFWGHFVALSDRAGTLGIQKLKFVVMACVISDRIERGGEATATSMLMMMANWPEFLVSPYIGAALLDTLNVKKGAYENLPWAILARTLLRLVPILFVPFLVPPGSSVDKTRYDTADLDLSSTEKSSTRREDVEGGALALSPMGEEVSSHKHSM